MNTWKVFFRQDAGVWIFSGWTHLIDVLNALKDNKLTLINHIIWKYQFGVFTRRKFVTSHYHILFAVKNEKDYFFNKIEHYPEDVWHINREYNRGVKKNATKLPPDVVRRCIDFGSVPGDLILDPFIGNGTTAIVAKGSYRYYLGFEINTTLKDIISKGLEKIQVGDDYIPYCNRPDELVDKLAQKLLQPAMKNSQNYSIPILYINPMNFNALWSKKLRINGAMLFKLWDRPVNALAKVCEYVDYKQKRK